MTQLSPGSQWMRWDPHVHAPGTIFNDQFGGDWDAYLRRIETAEPPVQALGITDYYGLDTYRAVVAHKVRGRLPGCDLIFPNVELRFSVGTARSWINAHLLVCPDAPDHLDHLERFLERLTFKTATETYCCNPRDLIKLGRDSGASATDERGALRQGSEQFKVSFDQLRDEYRASAWAQANVLIAVAGARGDGTSALQDGADQTLRREIERFAHIIFASSPAQRDFWLGRKATSVVAFRETYGGLKPCLHGSDGHSLDRTAAPDGERYSWVKGAPIFDTLRQACIDPAGRAFVGVEPPPAAAPSETIGSVTVTRAPWAATPSIALNAGLVAIIGARGSGKTALADIIAAGCDAHGDSLPDKAFLVRANEHLGGARVRLNWKAGDAVERQLDRNGTPPWDSYPRARYLSQQFVDALCSADGMTDGLLAEVERVVFDAHSPTERDGTVSFSDLRDLRAERHRQAREREELNLQLLSDRINVELEKISLAAGYRKQVEDKLLKIKQLMEDRKRLVNAESEVRVKRLSDLTEAANAARGKVRALNTREQKLLLLQDEVQDFRTNHAPDELRDAQERHRESGISEEDWNPFLVRYSGDVDGVLNRHLLAARKRRDDWRGVGPAAGDQMKPLIPDDADLSRQTLAMLEAEIKRLSEVITVDKQTKERFNALSTKVTTESELLTGLQDKLKDCEEARDRLKGMPDERERSYERVFEAVLGEERVLNDLYAPIRVQMDAAGGTLGKLSFSVSRRADLEAWAKAGQALLDLRRQGPFRGDGKLLEVATDMLRRPWERGDAKTAAAAVKAFRDRYHDDLMQHAPVSKTDQIEYRAWLKRFAKWLYATDHIAVRYSVDYDGLDIRKLSPGTRGIVLLLLYLALDIADERPLIIDQPEENLDPKSIFDELVGLFLAAKAKRQVIIVTHNANLVINTDADQIIVADVGPHPADGLPTITYESGGLENNAIRQRVCDILEGGEHAFRERARRLRVRLER